MILKIVFYAVIFLYFESKVNKNFFMVKVSRMWRLPADFVEFNTEFDFQSTFDAHSCIKYQQAAVN